MAHLKYYEMEKEKFSEANKRILYFGHAEIVFKKLKRHYKLYPHLTLRVGRGNHANLHNVTIANPTTFLVLCHEIAHSKHLMVADTRERWHGKHHFRIMKSMIKYCERKSWFEAEIARRTAPKPVKPEPSEQEKKAKELDKIRLKIKSWEGKKKRAENKLKKLRKREKSIQGRISTPQLPSQIDDKINQGEDSTNPPHQVPIPTQINAD